MSDQELYKAIGQLLFNESPEISKKISIVIYLQGSDGEFSVCDFTVWNGDKNSRETSFAVSDDGRREIVANFRELQQYFAQENMGEWNVAFFSLDPEIGTFNVDFENCKELDTGELAFWRYLQRYH